MHIRVLRKAQTPFIVRLNLEGLLRRSSTWRSSESSYSLPGRAPCSGSDSSIVSGEDSVTTGLREYQVGGLQIVGDDLETQLTGRTTKARSQHW
jgi:hypothetical protein